MFYNNVTFHIQAREIISLWVCVRDYIPDFCYVMNRIDEFLLYNQMRNVVEFYWQVMGNVTKCF